MTPPVPSTYARDEQTCPFAAPRAIAELPFRETPYWWSIATSRHLGIYRPHAGVCTWTARYLSRDKLYKQRALGPALDAGQGALRFGAALDLAEAWFAAPDVADYALPPKKRDRLKLEFSAKSGFTPFLVQRLCDLSGWWPHPEIWTASSEKFRRLDDREVHSRPW